MEKKILLTLTFALFLSRCNVGDQLSTQTDNYDSQSMALMAETIAAFPADSLTSEEISGLILMREEEKLARDVYLHLYETWGTKIFRNIANSEATHMEAVRLLIDRYELVDPVSEDIEGEFEDNGLATHYDDLTTFGDSSLVNAFTVGAIIEDLDISDLMNLSAVTDNEDILYVYDNLTRGSRNHIRSYVSNLNRYDETYAAQFISESLLDSILNTPKEVGNW